MSVSVPAADAFHSHANDGPQSPIKKHYDTMMIITTKDSNDSTDPTSTNSTSIAPASNSNSSQQNQHLHLPTWTQEWYLFWHLAGPTILISIGFTVPSFLTAAYIGRSFGPLYLGAYTLANLTGNLFSLSLLSGLYSASDTLSPQAFGAGNYRELGLIAIRALLCSLVILVPVNVVLLCSMGPILVQLGQDVAVAREAWQFYAIYVFSLPAYAVWCVAWKFLSAQAILRPLVVVTLTASFIVLPVAVWHLGDVFGFLGTATALVIFYLYQAVAIGIWMIWFQPHHAETWPLHWTWAEVFYRPALTNFLKLGLGGMLASLEWIYWEAISLVVGGLGIVPLSVHTIPTQVIFVAFMFPLGVGVAISNRIGVTMARTSVARAKSLALYTLVGSMVLFGLCTLLLHVYRWPMFRLFTSDPDVLQGSDDIWPLVCFYLWVLVTFGVNTGIATGLGMQMTLGLWTLVCLWGFGLPASYYFAVVRSEGLRAIWFWIIPPYALINLIMWWKFLSHDWNDIASKIRTREGAAVEVASSLMDEADGLEKSLLAESESDPSSKYGSDSHYNQKEL